MNKSSTIRYSSLEDAQALALHWGGQSKSLELLGHSGNSVYRFKNEKDQWQILRLTDPDFRPIQQVQAELHFIQHLHNQGASVATPIYNQDALLTLYYDKGQHPFIASSFVYAEGLIVRRKTPYWTDNYIKSWAKNIAKIHKSSSSFNQIDAFFSS